jgi:hypothetical protein
MLVDKTLDRYKRTKDNFFIITVNSIAYFIISFIVIYLLGQLLTAVIALQYDFKSVIYYHRLAWAIDSSDWTVESVKLLFSLAPLLSFIVGVICLIIYVLLYDERTNLKQFFLWGFAHGMVWFFGATLAGALLDNGIGYVIMYMYFQDTERTILSLLSLTALLLTAAFTTRWFLFSGNAYFNQLNEHNRSFFTYSQIIVPAFLGTLILILSKLPLITYYELFTLLTMLVFIIPILATHRSFPTFYFDEIPITIKADKKAIITASLMLVAFRVIFHFGIMIG